jgi:hypothetical protein
LYSVSLSREDRNIQAWIADRWLYGKGDSQVDGRRGTKRQKGKKKQEGARRGKKRKEEARRGKKRQAKHTR